MLNSLKFNITKKILEISGIDATEKRIKSTIPVWWLSTRHKHLGGLRLTRQGYEAFLKAGIKDYKIKFDDPVILTNQLILWIDNFIDCPFYLENKHITVFSEKMAVQLILFSGNIYQFSAAKAKSTST